MAITATFTSDWSQFIKGTEEAEAALDKFEQETEAAGGAITKMATSSKTQINDVTAAYRQFDGVLSGVGIRAGPAIKAYEDLAGAAGKSIGQLGKLATAGLVLGTFKAAFDVTRSVIDKFFPDLDNAIARSVSNFMGWGDVAAETAGAVADALAKASVEAGRQITNINEAVRINTQALADRTKKLKEQQQAEKDAAEATARVNIVLQDHAAVLATINPAMRLAAEHALRHGANQRDVALAYTLSAEQIAAVVDKVRQHEEGVKKLNEQLEEQKKKLKEADDLALASYTRQVENLKTITAERMKAYGTAAQIQMLKELEAAEVALAAKVYAQITSEKDRMTLLEQTTKRRLELGRQIMALEKEQTDRIAQGLLSEVQAHQKRMEMQGLDYNGYVKVDTALETLNQNLKALETQQAAGIPTQERAALLMAQFAQANYEAAKATDQVIDKNKQATQSFEELAAAMRKEAAERQASRPAGLVPNAIVGRNGVAMDMFGRPVVAGGGISQLPVVNISVGGNIIGTEAELARLVGSAVTGNYRKGGNRLPV